MESSFKQAIDSRVVFADGTIRQLSELWHDQQLIFQRIAEDAADHPKLETIITAFSTT